MPNNYHRQYGTSRFGSLARGSTLTALAALMPVAAFAWGYDTYSPWQPNVPVPDKADSVNGGCPIESRDGLVIYTARRDAPDKDLDIWANYRYSLWNAFGKAEKLAAPINGASDDFCPTPLDSPYLLFVSRRDGGCGGGDIYMARQLPWGDWTRPKNLGCAANGHGPNGPGDEFSPGIIETKLGVFLYYSSDIGGDQDIYVSKLLRNGKFAPGKPVYGLNTGDDDRMPTVSQDGLEMVFSSDRSTWGGGMSAGNPGQDVYYTTRKTLWAPWSDPVNLSVSVPFSTEADGETRASLSGDKLRISYGSGGEVYVSERRKWRDKNGPAGMCRRFSLPFCE